MHTVEPNIRFTSMKWTETIKVSISSQNSSNLRLFGYFQGISNLDAQISDSTLQLTVAKE
jgi:hypothetical protein